MVNSKTKLKESIGKKVYERHMSNYFSVGVESRVGLGFDKKRTTVGCCNKTVYFCESLKKLCCIRTSKIKDIVSYVTGINEKGEEKKLFASSKEVICDKYIGKIYVIKIIFSWKSCIASYD